MSGLNDCCSPCPDVQTVNVPGVQGEPGADGADGVNGVSAFTTVGADFLVPAIGANVTITVGNSTWMVVGQNIFIEGPANFEVVSIPGPSSVELEFLGYDGDVAPGATINSGDGVSPGGLEGPSSIDDPLLIANGGTSASTKAGAQLALGLGQTIVKSDSNSLAYDVTNSYASIGLSVVATAAGLWLIQARATVTFTGVTFASSRTLSLRVRNTTSGTTLAETTRATGVHTTATFPDIDYVLDFEVATLALNDTLQIQVQLDTVESAGSTVINSASLAIVPLALS